MLGQEKAMFIINIKGIGRRLVGGGAFNSDGNNFVSFNKVSDKTYYSEESK